MSFHIFVSPLKQTTRIDFLTKLAKAAKNDSAKELLKELSSSRTALLDLMGKWEAPEDSFLATANAYLALLRGLVDSVDGSTPAPGPGPAGSSEDAKEKEKPKDEDTSSSSTASTAGSPAAPAPPPAPSVSSAGPMNKFRRLTVFFWTNTLGKTKISSDNDTQFELISILEDIAIWYTKKANLTLGMASAEESDLKDDYRYLRIAAGILQFIETSQLGRLTTSASPSDTNPVAVRAYAAQLLAEAQEITIARGIEKKNAPSLLCSLSRDISDKFNTAAKGIAEVKMDRVDKWQKYLSWKSRFYLTYAYMFMGLHFLSKDECGNAIRVLSEAEKLLEQSNALGKVYVDCEPRTPVKIYELPVTQSLAKTLRDSLAKAKRENDFIYFHKIPVDLPELLPPRSLAEPEPYTLPPMSPKWSKEMYDSFDTTKVTPDHAPATPEEKDSENTKAESHAQHPQDKQACTIL